VVSRPVIISVVYFVIFIVIAAPVHAQRGSDCATAKVLREFLEQKHVAPQQPSEGFSRAVTKTFILGLDVNGLYFTQEDLEGPLAGFKDLEAAIEANECNYLIQLKDFLQSRLSHLDTLLASIQLQDLPASTEYKPRINALTDLTATVPSLEARWGAFLKRQLYTRKYLQSSDEVLKADNEAALFDEVVVAERCKLSKKITLLDEEEAFVPKAFYSALARSFDPHTNYYRYGFMEMLTAFFEEKEPSFGFQLVENFVGQISIGKLLPGGPAWRSNQLHVGDIITLISRPDGSEVDLSCSRLEEVQRIMSFSGKSIDLTVIGRSNEKKVVTLVKDKVAPNTNAVRGYVLGGEKKVGYISLPDFYTNEGEEDQERGCARDVAREIIKLNNDGIEGLIIDVRNNGGGSLQEALDLIGIFIDEGPLALMSKEDKIKVIGDRSRGAAYFGSLIILVNGQSASASELLAASLQDYSRALIVGDTTFGKAVGQEIEVLKSSSDGDKDDLESGIVKVTTSRIYRLKGKSYQQQGVVPDIYLPELLINDSDREATYPFSINPEDVDRDTYFKPYPAFPLAQLRASHERRLLNLDIPRVKALTDSIGWSRENMKYLNTSDFLKLRALNERKQSWFNEQVAEANKPFSATNHSFDRMIINISTQKKQIEMMTLRDLENNLYIRQAYQIMTDLINSTK